MRKLHHIFFLHKVQMNTKTIRNFLLFQQIYCFTAFFLESSKFTGCFFYYDLLTLMKDYEIAQLPFLWTLTATLFSSFEQTWADTQSSASSVSVIVPNQLRKCMHTTFCTCISHCYYFFYHKSFRSTLLQFFSKQGLYYISLS